MAVYRIRVPEQMRRWRQSMVLTASAFAMAAAALFFACRYAPFSTSLWMCVTVFSVLAAGVALLCVAMLFRSASMRRLYASWEYEITPEGVSSYHSATVGGHFTTLALAGSQQDRSHEDQPGYRFYARRELTGFESHPDGSIVVLARFWPTRLAIPAVVEQLDQLRQELLFLGLPEIRRSPWSRSVRRAAGIAFLLLLLFCSCYLFLGTNAMGVIASGVVYLAFFAWSALVSRRSSGNRRLSGQRLQFLTVAVMLLVVGLRIWTVTHPRPLHRATTTLSVPQK
jgi:hypothetical protein